MVRCAADFPGFFPGLGRLMRLLAVEISGDLKKSGFTFVFQSVLDREVLPIFSNRSTV